MNLRPSALTARVAVVTGASAGLGLAITKELLLAGYCVVAVARDEGRLTAACDSIRSGVGVQSNAILKSIACDVTQQASCVKLCDQIERELGRVDVLVNCVGQSDRGTIAGLTRDRLVELFDQNVTSTLFCSQAALPLLKQSKGIVINIGSLAAKMGPRFLGGYPAVKHALAGLTQQMRLEWQEFGIHVALLSPGPIQRQDSGSRYHSSTENSELPEGAMRPGGGSMLSGLAVEKVAKQALRLIRRRTPDLIMPRYVRLLVVLGHAFPRLGDWLLLKFTKQ